MTTSITDKRVVVLLSGGLDSTSLLGYALGHVREAVAITFDYGQRHRCEIEAAKKVAGLLSVPHVVCDMTAACSTVFAGSALTSPSIPVPEGHYEDASMQATVVPNRNMVMLSMAIAYAAGIGYDGVAIAAHAGDHAVYPDCREEFMLAMDTAAGLCHYKELRIFAPFVEFRKEQIVCIAMAVHAPIEFSWSCYNGRDAHCGKCGTCVERREAFAVAGVADPTLYEATP